MASSLGIIADLPRTGRAWATVFQLPLTLSAFCSWGTTDKR